ncbi:MAG: outer membrane protein, partial [Longimicrobiales bacterium]
DGFLFGRPKAQLTLRAGPVQHRAGGDLFDFFQSELTLDRGDFRAPAIGGDLSIVVHPRLDLAFGASWSNVESRSEFRDWVDEGESPGEEDDLPIEQVTSLRVTPLTASLRFYPLSRGTGISDLAWVPARTTPYLGGGGGMAWYRLKQEGDFVDADDLSIFTAEFESSGRTPVGHVFAGVDHWFTPRLGLNIEGRYTFGSATGSDDFADYDNIDVSGLQMGVGLALRW